MLHAALTRSPHAHAAVLNIDTERALSSPGVVDVVTAADLPGQLCTGPVRADRPVLAAGVVRHVGEPVAAVLATDPLAATAAAAAVAVEYRPLPAVPGIGGAEVDPLHPDGNLLRSVHVRRGQWPADAEVEVEGGYNTHGWAPRTEPFGTDGMPARPATVEVEPTDDGVRISAPRRWNPADRDQLAQCLNMIPRQITLVTGAGAVDHSSDLGGAVVAAVLARRNHRPVRLVLGPPTFGQGGGPLVTLRYRHHARADGTLVAVHADIEVQAGPYAGLIDALVAQMCAIGVGPYRVPAVDLTVTAVRSTAAPPMMEPGALAAAVAFAVEAQLDRLADRLYDWEQGRDSSRFVAQRRAVRERNLLGLDDPLPTGQLPLEDSPVPTLFARLDAVPLPERPETGSDSAWGTGGGVAMVPFGAGEGGSAPVAAAVRVTAGEVTVRCAAAEGDTDLEAVARRVAEQALGASARFEAEGDLSGGGSAATVGLAVQAAVDALTLPARERLAAAAGLSAGLLRVVGGRVRDFDGLVDEPLALAGDPELASAEYLPPGGEPLGPEGQGDAFAGFSYAAARALLRMSSAAEVEIVQLVVAADCGRVVDPDRARAAVEASAFTGIRLAMPEATLRPGAVQVHLLDGVAPKAVAGVAAGAVAAALRSAADQGAGGDAAVLPIPGVSWSNHTYRTPDPDDGGGMPPRYRHADGAS